MGFADFLKRGLNEIFYFGGEVDDSFWDDLEDTLVMGDLGAPIAARVCDDLREQAAQEHLSTADDLRDALAVRLAHEFAEVQVDPFEARPSCVLLVGVNGSGKTTTAGKLATQERRRGKRVLLGGADTFRAAAIEQLLVWGERADVEVVVRDRGADPASVCYDTLDRADEQDSDLVIIDTAGRLHTSQDLMDELAKVVGVTRKRAQMDVYVVLVIDATTGQNGLNQAREFNEALDIDALVLTKLDGTAKGGIALAISSELKLPVVRMGTGERIDDLQAFDPLAFCQDLVGKE